MVSIFNITGSSSLDHFNLTNLGFGIRVLYWACIFYNWSDQGPVSLLF